MSDVITDVVQHWCESERTGDTERLDDLLADDFVGIGPVGFVLDKAAWLSRFDQGLHYDDLTVDELVVRRHDGAALVVAHQHARGNSGDVPLPPDLRLSLTIVGSPRDRPRIAGMQYSFIRPPLEAVR
jgi:hypothetical protein